MKRSQKSGSRLILALISALSCWLSVQPVEAVEPEYQGKAVSEWLVAMQANLTDAEFITARNQNVDPAKLRDQKQTQAREAIRQIGTNSLPVLLDLLSAREGRQWRMSRRIQSKEIQRMLQDGNPDSREAVRGMAVDGFAALGTNAEPAVPELAKLLREDSGCLLEVARALNEIGPKGFMLFTNTLNTHPSKLVRDNMIWTIGHSSVVDKKAMFPLLIRSLNDPYWKIRGDAAEALRGGDAAMLVPVLIRTLNDDDSYTREQAYLTLGHYGSAAKEAVPRLMMLYTNHPDVSLLASLKAIDREAAGRAEEFLVNSGPLNVARLNYTDTILQSGTHLIVGGVIHTEIPVVRNRELDSAQLLDPTNGKWVETGKLHNPRDGHKATLLLNGKVLIEGGYDSEGNRMSNSELYDPATGSWAVVTNK
jgi:HEAT repeat protein